MKNIAETLKSLKKTGVILLVSAFPFLGKGQSTVQETRDSVSAKVQPAAQPNFTTQTTVGLSFYHREGNTENELFPVHGSDHGLYRLQRGYVQNVSYLQISPQTYLTSSVTADVGDFPTARSEEGKAEGAEPEINYTFSPKVFGHVGIENTRGSITVGTIFNPYVSHHYHNSPLESHGGHHTTPVDVTHPQGSNTQPTENNEGNTQEAVHHGEHHPTHHIDETSSNVMNSITSVNHQFTGGEIKYNISPYVSTSFQTKIDFTDHGVQWGGGGARLTLTQKEHPTHPRRPTNSYSIIGFLERVPEEDSTGELSTKYIGHAGLRNTIYLGENGNTVLNPFTSMHTDGQEFNWNAGIRYKSFVGENLLVGTRAMFTQTISSNGDNTLGWSLSPFIIYNLSSKESNHEGNAKFFVTGDIGRSGGKTNWSVAGGLSTEISFGHEHFKKLYPNQPIHKYNEPVQNPHQAKHHRNSPDSH